MMRPLSVWRADTWQAGVNVGCLGDVPHVIRLIPGIQPSAMPLITGGRTPGSEG